jgi:hypothetical protein
MPPRPGPYDERLAQIIEQLADLTREVARLASETAKLAAAAHGPYGGAT